MISVIMTSASPAATSPGISWFASWMISVASGRFSRANFSFSPPGFSITRTSGLLMASRLVYFSASSARHSTVFPFSR